MHNTTSQKLRIIFLLGFLFSCLMALAQTPVPPGFAPRLPGGSMRVKGDVVFVGNNILNRTPNPNTAYDGNTDNNGQTMEYIDIDSDASTRNSSSANLTLTSCDRVMYAGLYWASTYPYERSTDNGQQWNPSDANRYSDFNQIKFKLPTGAYLDITGTVLFDGRAPVLNQSFKDAPAICYKDVTSLVQGLTTPTGTYTVANMRSSKGQRDGSSSAGWVMVIIYENPTLPSKFISTYDGYAGVSSGQVDIPISGFVTLPSPNPVNARLGVGALEGDKGLTNDRLQFKANLTAGFTDIGNGLNPTDNFFNSTITNNDAQVPLRDPYGQNTLGLDLDMLPINNPNNSVIKNNETGATLRLKSSGDGFGAFLATFAVDIIEPNIKLVKKVQNSSGVDITGQNVTLSSILDYVITFDNIGNDDAKNLVIKDILPVNTTFVAPVVMPTITAAGGSYTYNAATHTILITVPNSLVLKDLSSIEHTIKIRVKVASSCNELTDACSSTIRNSAFATYQGVINTSTLSDNPSAAGLTTCGAPILGPANFLVDVSACVYSRNEVLCNGSLILTAGNGYGTYTWYKENGAVDIPMGTTQSITVNDTGIYYYDATPIAPCIVPIKETITVTNFTGVTLTNPVIAVADVSPICPNNGVPYPKIFLCGNTDSQYIPTGIGTGTVRWQKMNATCTGTVPADCPHQTCPVTAWDTVFTGPNYTVTDAGEYRIAYDANGTGACLTYFYFYVSKNNYTPQIAVKDIVCTTNGEIKVTNAPAGYQIKWINQTTNTVLVDYPNTNPVLAVTTPGAYAVEIKQAGVANGCIFRVNDITVLKKTISAVVTPVNKTCTVPGSINIQVQGVNPNYTYTLTGPATLTYGPDVSSNHTFTGLNPGTYAITVTTPDGCNYTGTATVNDYSTPVLNAAVTQSPTNCDPGVITLTPSAGKAPYTYSLYTINGVAQPLTYFPGNTYQVPVADVGTYVFTMIDANNCTVQSNAVIISNIIPTVTQAFVNPKCSSGNTGTITVSATGTGITYQLTSGATVITTNTSGAFTGLAAGSYTVNVIQTGTTTVCTYPYNFTLVAPTAVAGTASVTTPYTCTSGSATITAGTPSGGTPFSGAFPYQYSINGTTFGNSNTFTGLLAGTYSVTIKDANGCTFVTPSMTITAPAQVTNITYAATAVTCPAQTSNVTLTAVGGLAPFTYAMTAPSVINNGTTATFAGLAPGTYSFTATDAKGCTYSNTYTVNPITVIGVTGVTVNNVKCLGTATGAATYTVTGFGASYNYSVVSTGTAIPAATGVTSGTIALTNLAAGTYTVTVTNTTTNCTATAAVTITSPTAVLAATKNVVQPNCTVTTGSVTINATGGWGGNKYALTGTAAIGPQGSNSFTGLAAGNYTLSVTDANGCIVTDTFTITGAVAPVLAVTASDLCIPTTSITVAVNTGTGVSPFQYSLDGGTYQNGATFTGLAAGSHTITVKDANNCTGTVTRTINAELTAVTSIVKGLTCAPPPAAAQISVTIGGGLAPYNYEVKVGAAAFTAPAAVGSAVLTYSAATANTYQFRITDAAGCIVTTGTTTITPITPPQFAFGPSTPVKCFGDATGALAVNINPAFGTPPYVIAVTNTTTATSFGTQTTLLPAGTYSVTVTDNNGCTATNTTAITQPTAPISYTVTPKDITCNNPTTSFGEIKVSGVAGGTAPFTYYVSNNFGTNLAPYPAATGEDHTFIVVNFGIYTVNVVDANGCSLIKTNYVIASPPSDLNIDITAPTANCTTGGTVKVTVTAAVLSNNYEFGILTQSTVPYSTAFQSYDAGTPTIKTFTGLTPGVTYTFVVHDLVTDCYYFKTATGPVPTLSTITATATATPVTCTGAADGKVTFTVSGYSATTTQVDYQIFHYPSTLPITPTAITGSFTGLTGASATVTNLGNLAPGDYYVLFTEVDGSVMGCSKTSPVFTITQSTLLLVPGAVVTKNDNCGTNAGIITASAQYGTAPYSYQLVLAAATAPTAATWAGQASPILTGEGGNYIVYVKDTNNCIKPFAITLPTDVSPALTAVITPATQCVTAEGNFSIDVTRTVNGSVGPFLYSLDGGAFQPQADTFTYTGLTSGVHTVQIQDINGCPAAAAASVTIYPPVSVTAQPTVQPTCPANVGTITAAGSGGSASANYRYTLQTAAGAGVQPEQPSAVFTGVAAGNYKVVIRDTATNCTAEALVSLDATVPVTFTTAKDDVNCFGGNDGSITITLPNTNTDIAYTYTIDGALSAPVTQSTPVFTNLVADVYTVTVTSGKGCTDTATVTIAQPSVVTAAATATVFACAQPANTVNTSTVTITGGGGTPNYTYSIDGTNYFTSNTFSVIDTGATQNKTAYVKDDNGCIAGFPFSITTLPAITSVTAAQLTAITCTNDESVRVTVAGGSGSYQFELLPSGPVVTPAAGVHFADFSLTAPNNYTFKVTDLGTTCYSTTVPYTVAPFNTIDAVATASTPVVCFGSSTGSITIDVQGYTGAYNYQVRDAAGLVMSGTGNTSTNPFTIANVPAGSLFVRVIATATPFCTTDTDNITVGSPTDALLPNATVTAQVTCTNDKGEITAQATGGWGGYEYELVNTTTSVTTPYSTNNVFSALAAGNYTVNVKDSGNCIISQTNILLALPVPLAANATPLTTLLLCNGDTAATVTATASGGQGANTYEYILNTYDAAGTAIVSSTGAQVSNVFANLGAGKYSITVNDGWTCGPVVTNTVTITEPTQLMGNLSLTNSLSCTTGAELTMSGAGGTPPYVYSIDNGTTFVSGNAAGNTYVVTIPVNGAGTYSYLVQDNNGCTAVLTNEVEIAPVPALNLNLDLTGANVSCHGGNNATITANATGGLGNYQYELLNAASTSIAGPTTNGSFSGLIAGTYYVRVVSDDCNATSVAITITDPDELLTAPTVNNILCYGMATGSVTFTTTGGTGTVQYAISPNLNQFTDNPVFANLVAGTYDFIVQDGNGCFQLFTRTITQPTEIAASIVNVTDEACLGAANGTIRVTVTGGTGTYAISTDNITFTPFNPLTPGTYTLTGLPSGTTTVYVKDQNGCSLDPPMDQPILPGVNLDPQVAVNVTCVANAPSNTITVTTTPSANAIGTITYSIDGITYQASNVFTVVDPVGGTYTAYAKHVMPVSLLECIQTKTFTIVGHTAIAATPAITQTIDCYGALGQITITPTTGAGTGPFEYAIGPLFTYGTPNIFGSLPAGTYNFKVKDAIGCEFDITGVVLGQPAAALAVTTTHTDEICITDHDGTITVTPTGGTGNYEVSIDGGTTWTTPSTAPAVFTLLAPGTYTITVKDANGCAPNVAPADVTIAPGADLRPSVFVDPYCSNNVIHNIVIVSDDNIIVNNGFIQYSVDGAAFRPDGDYYDLAAGPHTATILHDNGCSKTISFTVDPLLPITASVTATTDVNCFGEATGDITVTATGGTGTLSYAIADADVLPLAFGTYQATGIFTGLVAGNYTVSILDDNLACETQVNATLAEPAAALTATETHTDEICLGANDGTITVTPANGTAPYQVRINGGVYSTASAGPATFAALTPNNYTVEILDAKGCTYTMPAAVTIAPGVDLQPSIVSNQVCDVTTITVSVNPAVAASVTYSLDGGTPQASNQFVATGLTAGSHNVVVAHSNGCNSAPLTFTVAPVIPIVMGATAETDVLCFGGTTGTATVTATGGTLPLTYAIAPNVLPLVYGTYQSSNTFTGLATGSYVINVKDALGCESPSATITVGQPAAALAATATHTEEICLGANDGTITVTATNGTAPYEARINNGAYTVPSAAPIVFSALVPGTYTIDVRDANGCTFTLPATITVTPGVDLQPSIVSNQVCDVTTITVSVNPTVAASVTYALDGGTPQTANQFVATGLTAGTHSVVVTHSNGCNSAPLTFTVAPVIPIVMGATAETDVLCFGGTTGTATVTATGGTLPLTYAIAPNVLPLVYGTYQSSSTFTGLATGSYVINVKDALGCESPSATITVGQPAAALAATATHTDEICLGANDGTITVTATNGTAPYEARINNGAYTVPSAAPIVFSALVPGTYTIDVRDANGCTFTLPATITVTPGVNLQPSIVSNQVCDVTTITVSVNPTVAASVTYALDGGTPQTANQFVATGLTAGTHSVVVTHSNGCNSAPLTFTVAPVIPIVISGTSKTDVNCFGGATGTATVTVTGGTTPLTYAISLNTTPPVYSAYQASNTFTGLAAGDYIINVKDALGCESPSAVINVAQPIAALTAAAPSSTNEICIGANDGTITVTPAGGTAPYEARINNGAYTVPSAAPIVFSALVPGTYTIDVRDANGCTFTLPATITVTPGVNLQPSIVANQVCNVTTITVSVNPAVAASVTYALDGGTPQASNQFVATGLTAGSHSVVVTHSNGCNSAPLTFNVAPVIPIVMGIPTKTDVLCFGGATGTATVTVTGGTTPLTYAISLNTTPPVYSAYQASNTFTGLAAGDYIINVKDALGCESPSAVINIIQPVAALTAAAPAFTNETCINTGNGTINVTPAGGTAPYEARINGGAYTVPTPAGTAIAFNNLTPGSYSVDVRDANGCTYTVPAAVTIAPGVDLQATVTTTQVCNVTTNTISVNPALAGQVTYSLDGGASQATSPIVSTGLAAGNHYVDVTHSNGCTVRFPFTVAPVIPIVMGVPVKTDVLCFGGATGTATVTATGGTAPLTYAISANVTPRVYGAYQATGSFTGLAFGSYVINVKDAIGCESESVIINIGQPTQLAALVTKVNEVCIGEQNGQITVNPQGTGTSPYQVRRNNGAYSAASPAAVTYTNLAPGSYVIDVLDASGCTFTQTVTIAPGATIQATVATTQVCADVTVNITVDPAIAAGATYEFDNSPRATANFTEVAPTVGQHIVTVNYNGCSVDYPITVDPTIPINLTVADVVVTDVACHGKDVGSIVVNATGGTGQLKYALTWGIWPTPIYQTSNTFTDLLANENEGYTVWVKDGMGCIKTVTVLLDEPDAALLIAGAVGQQESCVNSHDGIINLTVTGGTAPYATSLNSPNNFQQGVMQYTGLYGGSYDVYVRDARGCYAKVVVVIEKGVNLVPNIQTVLSCVNNVPVTTVTATLSTIVNNVVYKLETATGTLIQDFAANKTWELTPGNYVYTVRHVNGCQKTFAFTVQPRNPIIVTSVTPTATACNGGTDGTLTVVATGGTGNLTYGISPDYVMSPNRVFTGLAAGAYTVRVQDQYGCFVDFNTFPPVSEPAALAVTDVMNLPETCIDDNDAAFEIDITGGTAPYATSLDANGPFVDDQTLFDNLDGGTYTVYIQDANGCTITHDVILVSPLDIDAKAEVAYNCSDNTVTIVTNGSINQTELNYTLTGPKNANNPPQVSNVFSNLEDGSYEVEVINTVTGCTDTANFTIVSVPDLALSVVVSGLNQIKATVAGGEGPYRYTFDGDSMGTKAVFTYFRSGIYEITVTDSRGCTKVASIEVEFIDVILPDVVSPDGDGQNDTWSPGNTANYPNINSDIFDRYGRKLATLRQGDVWDGVYDGNPMPTGDYWFLVKLGDAEDRSFTGHFTIYR